MHPLLLFTLLFLPGFIFATCTPSVKKELDRPFLNKAFRYGSIDSGRHPLLDFLMSSKTLNFNMPQVSKNGGNVCRTMEYHISPSDKHNGKPVCFVTIEYHSYDPLAYEKSKSIVDDKRLLSSDSYGQTQDLRCMSCPFGKTLTNVDFNEKHDLFPLSKTVPYGETNNHQFCKMFNKKSSLNDYIKPAEGDIINIKKTKGKSPAPLTMAFTKLSKPMTNDNRNKNPLVTGEKFNKFVLNDKKVEKTRDNVNTDGLAYKNNKWIERNEKNNKTSKKLLLLKKIKKIIDELSSKENVNKKYISFLSNIVKNGLKNHFNTVSSSGPEQLDNVKKDQVVNYGSDKADSYESKKQLSQSIDASPTTSVKMSSEDNINERPVENTYSVKMNIEPLLYAYDDLETKKPFVDAASLQNLESSHTFDGLPFHFINDNLDKDVFFRLNKNRSHVGKREVKEGQTLLNDRDLNSKQNDISVDESNKNTKPLDEPLFSYKVNILPESLEKGDPSIIAPVQLTQLSEFNDKFDRNDKGLATFFKRFEIINDDTTESKKNAEKKVEIPLKIILPDSNEEEIKILTPRFNRNFKILQEESTMTSFSTDSPQKFSQLKNLQLSNTQVASESLVLSSTSSEVPSTLPPQIPLDPEHTVTKDAQAISTPDPYEGEEELSLWDKIKSSFISPLGFA